jgi:hypothetical protein
MVLRKIFGSKREEVAGGWRRLHNQELHNLYDSPNIIRILKLRRMGGAGHVARMGAMKHAYSTLAGKPEGRDHSEDVGVNGRIILEWILRK